MGMKSCLIDETKAAKMSAALDYVMYFRKILVKLQVNSIDIIKFERDFLENNGIVIPEEYSEFLLQYESNMDSVDVFLSKGMVNVQNNLRIKRKRLYELYRWFCGRNQIFPLSEKGFFKLIREKGYSEIKSNGAYYFIGIGEML